MDNPNYFPAQKFGGGGGIAFNDVTAASGAVIVGIKTITIRSGTYVDAIQKELIYSAIDSRDST